MPNAFVVSDGRFKSAADQSQLFALIAQYTNMPAPRPPLVLHFHGGLVPEHKGLEIANALTTRFVEAGGFPLFMVWRTGIWETLHTALPVIVGERIFKRILDAIAKRTPDEASVAVASFDEDAEVEALRDEIDSDLDLLMELELIRTEAFIASSVSDPSLGIVRSSAHTLMSPDVIAEIRTDQTAIAGIGWTRIALGAGRILHRLIRRWHAGRLHGTYPSIVEEICREFYIANLGQQIWGEMKRYTRSAFDPAPNAAGTVLVEQLADLMASGTLQRLVLTGHSAGSIYICELLDQLDVALARRAVDREIRVDVVFLAPAVTHDRFAECLRQRSHRIGAFRMFTMIDELESRDALIDLPGLKALYPRSLLYFISGVLEAYADAPIVGMHRYLAQAGVYSPRTFPNIDEVRRWLNERADRIAFSTGVSNGEPGLETEAVDHGDFDNDPATVRSMQHIITHRPQPTSAVASKAPSDATFGTFIPAGRLGDQPAQSARLAARDFTGRFLVRFPHDQRGTMARQLHNLVGVRSDIANASATAAQFETANTAPIAVGLGVVAMDLSRDQLYRLTDETSAAVVSAHLQVAPERRVYVATGNVIQRSRIDNNQSWALGSIGALHSANSGEGIRAMVLDTGFDPAHPDFSADAARVHVRSFVPGNDTKDRHGHGMHCVGLVAGPSEPTTGVRYGVAPGVDLFVGKVLGDSGGGNEFDVISGMSWALTAQVDVLSLSLVLSRAQVASDGLLEDVLLDLEAAGVFVIAATGNDSRRSIGHIAPVRRPASFPSVLGVGAVNDGGVPADFSNAGPGLDCVAPGQDVLSAWIHAPYTRVESGTSMATPLATGVAALLAQQSGLRGQALRQLLLARCQPLSVQSASDVGAGLVRL